MKLLVLQAHVPCANPTATCVLLAVRSAVRDKDVCWSCGGGGRPEKGCHFVSCDRLRGSGVS